MASQSSPLCPATGQPHGTAWACGSCFAQNLRSAAPRGPKLVDIVSESESEPELEIADLEAEVIDLISEPESELELEVIDLELLADLEPEVDLASEVIDLVSESGSEPDVIDLEPDVDLDLEVIDLTLEAIDLESQRKRMPYFRGDDG